MENYYSSSAASSSSSFLPVIFPCTEPNNYSFPWQNPYNNNDIPNNIQESGQGFPFSWSNSIQIHETAEDKAASVSKSHSQAEKRRRDRINAQLGVLRKLIPKSDKMDKAALLGCVIDHVKDLKEKALEVSKNITIPTENDEVTVAIDDSNNNITNSSKNIFIRATLCCDDRPEVFPELIQVIDGLKLSIVRADIASVGGRVKNILLLCNKVEEEGGNVVSLLGATKQALIVVLSRISSSSMPSNYRIRSKRQRFFLPSHQQ